MSQPAERALWLIRHAPVLGPVGVIHAPEAPADTTDRARLGRLAEALPRDAPAWCSPSRRTVETARALSLSAHEVTEFREQAFGAWTGRRHAELREEFGPEYDRFWERPHTARPPGGESFSDQVGRVGKGLERLPRGPNVLVVHSGTVRAVLALSLGSNPRVALQFVIEPLSLTRVDQLGSAWRIVCVNQCMT